MATFVERAMSIATALVPWLMTAATALLGLRFLAFLVEFLEEIVLANFFNGHIQCTA